MSRSDAINHLESEKRYAEICRKSLEADPEYYQPQLDATLRIITRIEDTLAQED